MKKRTFILFVVMGLLEASNMACGQQDTKFHNKLICYIL